MTEAEWLECHNLVDMLSYLSPVGDGRKPLLLACACLARIWNDIEEEARNWARIAGEVAEGGGHVTSLYPADIGCFWEWGHTFPSAYVVEDLGWHVLGGDTESEKAELREHAKLVRCIFGNPFRSVLRAIIADPAPFVASAPTWIAADVVALAKAIYADRAFDGLPILADALEVAGCMNRDILDHCREPGPHARGCWVVDLVLGKK